MQVNIQKKKLPGKELINKYKPLKVISINTKGKLMWFELRSNDNQDIFIINNFGLTANWSFYTDKSDRIIFDIETHPDQPEKNKKYKLHYSDARNFGLMQITNNRQILDDKINKLAPDLLKSNFTPQDFKRWVNEYLSKSSKRRDVPIVKALLRQDKKDGIASGIGNYLSSEILYRSKISPYTKVGDLTDAQLTTLANTIKYVVKLCYMSNITGYMKKLAHFIPKHKEQVRKGVFPNYHPDIKLNADQFAFLVYARKEDDLGNKVERDNIETTRTTYWVPAVQK